MPLFNFACGIRENVAPTHGFERSSSRFERRLRVNLGTAMSKEVADFGEISPGFVKSRCEGVAQVVIAKVF